jgi:NAD(P)-dependent dehydrogenase (short-subunit alcohol dehydrogenase family)
MGCSKSKIVRANTVVLIAGSSRGIGLATADHLSKMGYIVYGSSRQQMEDIKFKHGGTCKMVQLEVTDAASCERAVEAVIEREGRLDVLINMAAYHLVAAHAEQTLQEVRDNVEVNFWGSVNTMKAATPQMLKQRSGKIINMTSVIGETAFPFCSAYASGKFALYGYSEAARMELLPFGITICMVSPAGVKTGTLEHTVREPATRSPLFQYITPAQFQRYRNPSAADEKMASSVEDCAKAIEKLVVAKNPNFVTHVGFIPKFLMCMKRMRSQVAVF